MKVCVESGCPELTTTSRCTQHTRDTDRARGSRQQRGYNNAHDHERRRWAPLVRTGAVNCARCHTRITPTDTWHLDHNADRTGYLGPSHARCNTSAAGKAAHRRS